MNCLLNSSTDPFFNMAFDSYVLENTSFEGFYLWQNAPSVIVGLNQSVYAEVNLPYIESHGISLVRRVSGGGAVYHDLGNVNYSFVGSEEFAAAGPGLIAAALRSMGVPAELTGRNDIMVSGRKCSGYAKRFGVGGHQVLVHGTLMFDVDLEALTSSLATPGSKLSAAGIASVRSRVANLREYLDFNAVGDLIEALRECLQGDSYTALLNSRQTSEIEAIAASKFRSWDWVYGHSPAAEFSCTRKFACGTVTARYSLRHGRLADVAFDGDFIGPRPASELAALLTGLSLPELRGLHVTDWFDGLSAEEFLSLFY